MRDDDYLFNLNNSEIDYNNDVELFRLKGILSSIEATLVGLDKRIQDYQNQAAVLYMKIKLISQKNDKDSHEK